MRKVYSGTKILFCDSTFASHYPRNSEDITGSMPYLRKSSLQKMLPFFMKHDFCPSSSTPHSTHLRQFRCHFLSTAFRKNSSVMRSLQPAHRGTLLASSAAPPAATPSSKHSLTACACWGGGGGGGVIMGIWCMGCAGGAATGIGGGDHSPQPPLASIRSGVGYSGQRFGGAGANDGEACEKIQFKVSVGNGERDVILFHFRHEGSPTDRHFIARGSKI